MATPTFNYVYTIKVIRPLRLIFPRDAIDVLMCHDDTTIIADAYLLPPDDPEGTRLKETSDDDLRDLICKAVAAPDSPTRIALYLHGTPGFTPTPSPAIIALTRIVIPHFALIIQVFRELLRMSLGLKLAAGR